MKETIATIINQILAEHAAQGAAPLQCSLNDIILRLRPMIIDAMRSLVIEGRYRPGLSINKIPLVLPNA